MTSRDGTPVVLRIAEAVEPALFVDEADLGDIRVRTIHESDRATRSIVDHMHIIEALEARDTDLAERLVREHTLSLRQHVEENVALD